MEISTQEYTTLTDLIEQRSGLHFEQNKDYFIKIRLAKRMELNKCDTVNDYIRFLRLDSTQRELDEFVDALTTNETYFYRELPQLMAFIEGVLPLIMEKKRARSLKSLRIWSAACSTGCEPYTLAILLKEHVPDIADWHVQIIGTDINNQILHKCRVGVYGDRALKDVPPQIKSKYFKGLENNEWEISQEIKNMVKFNHLNLIDKRQMRSMVGFDFVFCRNVLIYFEANTSKQILSMFYDSLNTGGFIFLGHSESVSRFSAAFKVERVNNSLVYQKPE